MNLLAPIYLIGLFAIGLPLWLHLINRDKPLIRDFASSMFLESAQISSSSVKTVRFRKLLFLRLVLITLLACLFAEPIINRLDKWTKSDKTLHVLLIDRSFSMRHSDRWRLAIQKAKDLLITNLPEGDEALVFAADQRLTQVGDDSSNRKSLAVLLSGLKPGFGRLRFDVMTAQLQSLIDNATLPVNLYLFTDAQKSGLSARVRDLIPRGATELQVVVVGSDTVKNTYISSAKTVQQQNDGEVTLYLAGLDQDSDLHAVAVLKLENNIEISGKIEKSASGDFIARFSDLTLHSGINRFTATVNIDDELPEDNQYFVAINSGRRYPIVFFNNNNESTAQLFLRTALQTDERFVAIEHEHISSVIPGNSGLIVVADLSLLTESEKNKVNEFVEQGGSAFMVTGSERPQNSLYQTNPASTIGFVDTSHPIIANTESWRKLSIYHPVDLELHSNDRLLLALSDGSPFLIERSIGKGRQIIMASSLDATSSNLPTSSVFVPFVLRVVLELTGLDNDSGEVSAGSTLYLESGEQLFSESGESLIDLSLLGTENSIELNQPGIYTLRSKAQTSSVVVNTDRMESTMQRLDADFLADWESLVANKAKPQVEQQPQLQSHSQHQHLWYWILPALLILAVLEAIYANSLLNNRRGATS